MRYHTSPGLHLLQSKVFEESKKQKLDSRDPRTKMMNHTNQNSTTASFLLASLSSSVPTFISVQPEVADKSSPSPQLSRDMTEDDNRTFLTPTMSGGHYVMPKIPIQNTEHQIPIQNTYCPSKAIAKDDGYQSNSGGEAQGRGLSGSFTRIVQSTEGNLRLELTPITISTTFSSIPIEITKCFSEVNIHSSRGLPILARPEQCECDFLRTLPSRTITLVGQRPSTTEQQQVKPESTDDSAWLAPREIKRPFTTVGNSNFARYCDGSSLTQKYRIPKGAWINSSSAHKSGATNIHSHSNVAARYICNTANCKIHSFSLLYSFYSGGKTAEPSAVQRGGNFKSKILFSNVPIDVTNGVRRDWHCTT
jgi:hypothetical protein